MSSYFRSSYQVSSVFCVYMINNVKTLFHCLDIYVYVSQNVNDKEIEITRTLDSFTLNPLLLAKPSE